MIRSDNKRKSIETINSEYVYLLEFYWSFFVQESLITRSLLLISSLEWWMHSWVTEVNSSYSTEVINKLIE